jgi:hypothetical protein
MAAVRIFSFAFSPLAINELAELGKWNLIRSYIINMPTRRMRNTVIS